VVCCSRLPPGIAWPVVAPVHCILTLYAFAMCVLRYGGSKLERARDLFETALRDAPPEKAKPLFLEYAALEEQHGLARHAMEVRVRFLTVGCQPSNCLTAEWLALCRRCLSISRRCVHQPHPYLQSLLAAAVCQSSMWVFSHVCNRCLLFCCCWVLM
jgi:hypothetical protein